MKVSICICCFERQDELDRLLRWYEDNGPLDDLVDTIYVVDDASAVNIVVPSSCAGVPILLHRNTTNLGLIGARNTLIKLACSDSSTALLFNDDDLYIYRLRDGITAALSSISSGKSVVSIPYIDMPATDSVRFVSFGARRKGRTRPQLVNYFFGGSCVISKSTFTRAGLLIEDYRIYLEEEDFALRLTSLGLKMEVMWGGGAFGIHDHGRGKESASRAKFLISNRFLFLRRFVGRRSVTFVIWLMLYTLKYLAKYRSVAILVEGIKRYRAMRALPVFEKGGASRFNRFMLKRLL